MGTRVRRRRAFAVALAALLLPIVAGCAASTESSASPASVASAAPSPGGAIGGSVTYKVDGAPTTTEVDVVATGASVSGTAVTTSGAATHTVQLECAVRDGDTWILGGTTKETTAPDGKVGDWSAVIVKDGSPQQIGIWVSDDKVAGVDCDRWLGGIDVPSLPADAFNPVESGALVPPAAS